uniref:Uncharacterized protein n=1 Tax=Tanacetum cinerariifolium TaxID=118510 RepID=A0A6L2P9P5_TANCI|nr:hypothetical protein [Tanacetum cinerariifolium]
MSLLKKPKSLNPFLPTTQVGFTFEEIAFTTNTEFALLYPSHLNQEYFKDVSDFISKCCLKETFTKAPTQYKEHLSEFWYTIKTLKDSKVWVSTLTGGVRGDIGYSEEIGAKGTLKKSCLPLREKIVPYPRFIALLLKHMMPEYDNEELTINPTQGPPVKMEQTLSSVVVCLHLILIEPILFIFFYLHSESSRHDASVDYTAEADPGLSAPNDSIPSQQDLLKDTRSAFFTPDSPHDEPIIVSNGSEEEEEVAKDKDSHASSHDVPEDTLISHPPSPKSAQIQELMAQVKLLQSYKDKLEQQKAKAKAKVNIQWELLVELQELPVLVSLVQKQLKTLDSLLSLLNRVSEIFNRFATMVENASKATTQDVPSAGQATASPAEWEKNTKNAETNIKIELVDLLGTHVMTQYYNKKLLFDQYYDKMLKR